MGGGHKTREMANPPLRELREMVTSPFHDFREMVTSPFHDFREMVTSPFHGLSRNGEVAIAYKGDGSVKVLYLVHCLGRSID